MNEIKTDHFPRTDLVSWYREHARDLPWRETNDSYRIWISEIMLQQTRVETVIPYYHRFLEVFPNIKDLAEADQDKLLRIWEGLGYYSRARNLHKTAQIVMDQHQGSFPKDLAELEKLPGIGPYTAGAIASIAFDLPAAILDGNLKRLLTRFFGIDTPLQTAQTEKTLWTVSRKLVPDKNPGEFNQAMMELGAMVCTPKKTDCGSCPLNPGCYAEENGLQDQLPNRKKKAPVPHYQVTAAVIQKDDRYLLTKRPEEGLLGGLWEFPGGKQEPGESLEETLTREIQEELAAEIEIEDYIGSFDHAYTHYKVTLHAFHCRLISEQLTLLYHTDLTWSEQDSLSSLPMGKLDRLIANRLRENSSDPR